jgi:hypothetical protein
MANTMTTSQPGPSAERDPYEMLEQLRAEVEEGEFMVSLKALLLRKHKIEMGMKVIEQEASVITEQNVRNNLFNTVYHVGNVQRMIRAFDELAFKPR